MDGWTIGDALKFLHPPIPRDTLKRLIRPLAPVGERPPANGGPPIKVYAPADVMRVHAEWVGRQRPSR